MVMMMITTIDYYDGADHDGGDDDLSEAFLREGEPPSEAEAGVCARLCVCVFRSKGQRVEGLLQGPGDGSGLWERNWAPFLVVGLEQELTFQRNLASHPNPQCRTTST